MMMMSVVHSKTQDAMQTQFPKAHSVLLNTG